MGDIDISGRVQRMLCAVALAAALTAGISAPVAAQQADDQGAQDAAQLADPPMRAGRLSYLEGSVSLQPAAVDDWNAAPLNQPLTVGDALWSDTGSRAEMDLGAAVVRIDARSSVALLDLSDRAIQLRLDSGSIDITVNDVSGTGAFEIDAPNAAVLLLRAGEYRLSVDNAGNTGVAVRSGQASVQSGDQQNMNVAMGQRGFYGMNGSYAVTQAGAPDEFDQWCQQRQAHWLNDQAVAQYVSSDVVGYEDLNDYGQWQQEPDYGAVWFPTQVADDWAPYTTGHWAWVAPWGWNWVDEAPWGFAPFHYGRWGHVGRRWCWIPSPRHRHAIYAPALVAWVGGPGGGATMALGGGTAVGWVPLGPGEVYVPASRVTRRYFQDINSSNSSRLIPGYITSVENNPALQNRYINRDVPGALTVIPQSNFTAGQPVGRHRIAPPAQFQSANFAARAPGIAPERASVIGALSLDRVRTPPATVIDRAVITHRPPPPPPPSFERQAPAIAANGGMPLDTAQLRALRSPAAMRPTPATFAAQAAAVTPAPAAPTAPGAPVYRGIPERSPQFQQPMTNVFRQRDRELQQQSEQQQLAQQAQETQIQQRLKQDRIQQEQLRRQGQQQFQQPAQQQLPPPQFARAPPQVTPPPPAPHPRTDIRRAPEPITPAQAR
jgi:hypothetical protein